MTFCLHQLIFHLRVCTPTKQCIGLRRRFMKVNVVDRGTSRLMSSDKSDEGSGKEKKVPGPDDERQPSKEDTNKKLLQLIRSITEDTKKKAGRGKSVDLAIKAKEKRPPPKNLDPEERRLGKRMMAAVHKVAEKIGDEPEEIKNELITKLKSQNVPQAKLSDLFQGMHVDKADVRSEGYLDLATSRAQRVKLLHQTQFIGRDSKTRYGGFKRSKDRGAGPSQTEQLMQQENRYTFNKESLFGGIPLHIFTAPVKEEVAVDDQYTLNTWDKLYQKELKDLVTHPPANGFEEQIMWTEQKRLWYYPINNEQGMTEEAKYTFEDHIFLETNIDSWCPKKGPIREFMDLVCVGLSKNSYLTVPEKRAYLDWYHDYFKLKADIIKQVGAGEIK